jgi:hypothetical protein
MRIVLWSTVAAGVLFASGADAQKARYKYCTDDNMQCYYSTYKQCMADAAGTAGDCTINPRYRYSAHKPLKPVKY